MKHPPHGTELIQMRVKELPSAGLQDSSLTRIHQFGAVRAFFPFFIFMEHINPHHLAVTRKHPVSQGEAKRRTYLVVSGDADICFYNEATDTCIDPHCLTIIDEILATSEQDAINKVRECYGIPDWISLFCYPWPQ